MVASSSPTAERPLARVGDLELPAGYLRPVDYVLSGSGDQSETD
jgi:hypothetical protein